MRRGVWPPSSDQNSGENPDHPKDKKMRNHVNQHKYFILIRMVLVWAAFSSINPGLGFSENTLKKETSLTTRQARLAVELAWDKYHHAALGGTLASPTIQTELEMNLHKSRALLAEAYERRRKRRQGSDPEIDQPNFGTHSKSNHRKSGAKKMIAARKILSDLYFRPDFVVSFLN